MNALVLVCGIAGYYGVNRLSESLEYVTGPAWDVAGGAMEGGLSKQQTMLLIEEIFSGLANMDTVHAEIEKSDDVAEKAGARMRNSGLLSDVGVSKSIEVESHFDKAADEVVKQFAAFSAIDARLEDNFFDFQLLITQAEYLGDSMFEDMQTTPNKKISWNTGLDQAWTAADGVMMSQIGALKAMYFYRRMSAFVDLQGSIAGIKESNEMLYEESKGVIAHNDFNKSNVYEGKYQGQSFSSALTQAIDKHKKDFADAIAAFKTYSVARNTYEAVSILMLETLAEPGKLGAQTMEAEKNTISSLSHQCREY